LSGSEIRSRVGRTQRRTRVSLALNPGCVARLNFGKAPA
jgi:hypothetical protein